MHRLVDGLVRLPRAEAPPRPPPHSLWGALLAWELIRHHPPQTVIVPSRHDPPPCRGACALRQITARGALGTRSVHSPRLERTVGAGPSLPGHPSPSAPAAQGAAETGCRRGLRGGAARASLPRPLASPPLRAETQPGPSAVGKSALSPGSLPLGTQMCLHGTRAPDMSVGTCVHSPHCCLCSRGGKPALLRGILPGPAQATARPASALPAVGATASGWR